VYVEIYLVDQEGTIFHHYTSSFKMALKEVEC
jgi:hypothetical protein